MRVAAILGPLGAAKAAEDFASRTRIEWTPHLENADATILFGGDGTIHRHLATLVETKIPLLVVPGGSGNDFARALGIRRQRHSLKAWRAFTETQQWRTVDLGIIRTQTGEPKLRYFSCVAGVGIDSEIAKQSNEFPNWLRSRGGYGLSAVVEIFRFAPFPMRVASNGNVAAFRPTILAAVANAPAYGGGMKIAPHAKLDDGKLDLCVVRAMDPFKLFCLFPTVYFGRHLGFKEVEYEQTRAVRVETEFPFDVYADGEYVCQTPVEFGVAPNALKVIAPE